MRALNRTEYNTCFQICEEKKLFFHFPEQTEPPSLPNGRRCGRGRSPCQRFPAGCADAGSHGSPLRTVCARGLVECEDAIAGQAFNAAHPARGFHCGKFRPAKLPAGQRRCGRGRAALLRGRRPFRSLRGMAQMWAARAAYSGRCAQGASQVRGCNRRAGFRAAHPARGFHCGKASACGLGARGEKLCGAEGAFRRQFIGSTSISTGR